MNLAGRIVSPGGPIKKNCMSEQEKYVLIGTENYKFLRPLGPKKYLGVPVGAGCRIGSVPKIGFWGPN